MKKEKVNEIELKELLEKCIENYKNDNKKEFINLMRTLKESLIFEPKLYELFAYNLYVLGEIDECKNVLFFIKENSGLNKICSEMLLSCLLVKGQYINAISIAKDLVEKNPGNSDYFEQLIFCYFHSGHDSKGYEQYKLKNKISPNYSTLFSIVIPVLDLSPGTPNFNIITLLEDLKGINCEVIVIFNNTDLGQKLCQNSRIDHFAILKENVGVARAWNIGLNISRSKYTVFLNADMRVSEKSILDIVNVLDTNADCAITGPQGFMMDLNYYGPEYTSENNYSKEFKILEKNDFDEITEVDFIMGFFFAVKTSMFHSGEITFDNNLTPAFYEEIDVARKIRKLGYKLLAVPTNEYNHGGSGSHILSKTINYYDQNHPKVEILNRNAAYLYHKWFVKS